MKKKKFEIFGLVVNILLTILFTATLLITFNNHIKNIPEEQEIILLLIIFFSIYITMYLQLIIHELGHLIFGLLSGYKFSSFRVGNIMLIKQGKKFKFKKIKIAGTAGQCLMSPPDLKDDRMPVLLYNLGGAILNVISCIIFFIIYLFTKNNNLISVIFELSIAYGIYFAALNAIPMKTGTIDNDGYNALSLIINPNSQKAMWTQLKVNELLSKGTRLKNMPDEWFYIPKPVEMKNNLIATVAVFTCNRLIDQHNFDEANDKMKQILRAKTAIVGIHRNLLVCDRIYCELLNDNKTAAKKLMTSELKNFMNSMKDFPSIIRTNYTYTLLVENDPDKADKYKKHFIEIGKTYPYQADIRSEKELIDIVTNINKNK
jgi:hypothetical protein